MGSKQQKAEKMHFIFWAGPLSICMPLKRNLGAALDVIRHHHEKLDGSGYPDGLKGSEISMVARIMAVADIYDALATERPYRKAFPPDKVNEILLQESRHGKIDPDIVVCLFEIFHDPYRHVYRNL